jgi:hypothetical protein
VILFTSIFAYLVLRITTFVFGSMMDALPSIGGCNDMVLPTKGVPVKDPITITITIRKMSRQAVNEPET